MLRLRKGFGRLVAPLCAFVLSLGGLFVLTHAGAAGASVCTTTSADTDLDRLPDCWESANGLIIGRLDSGSDRDRDGLRARTEYAVDVAFGGGSGNIADVYHANDDDTDNNGVEDGDEDVDGDGLTNENETEARTNVLDSDTDNDGVEDGVDDTDNDGIDNEDEGNSVDEDGDTVGVDDLSDDNGDDISDANEDFDCDGVKNRNELNAFSANSDRHGVTDAFDDSDQDGIDNWVEPVLGDDAIDADSNDDGVEDGDSDTDQDGVEDGVEDGDQDNDSQDDGDCTVAINDEQ